MILQRIALHLDPIFLMLDTGYWMLVIPAKAGIQLRSGT